MSALASLFLAAGSVAQPAYPADEVLQELSSVCFADNRDSTPEESDKLPELINHWAEQAEGRGWREISYATADLTRLDWSALGTITALNHTLFGGFALNERYLQNAHPMLGGQIFKKSMAGRVLYLSVFAADNGSNAVGECRIHDMLGDGITRNPIERRNVENLAGGLVQRQRGSFGSHRYRWSAERGSFGELGVHFGFGGWGISPFGTSVERFNPYAPYGLTLVAGFHERIILV